ncbi:MAG TPA: hypothetical protein VGA13_12225 [Acidimicrobiales bacterium]
MRHVESRRWLLSSSAVVVAAATALWPWAVPLPGGATSAAGQTEDDGPAVVATMLVDRPIATTGETIHYAVRVDNIGETTMDEVVVTSHYPVNTTAATQSCPEGTFEPDGDICVQPDVPVIGAGDITHQIVRSHSPLEAGDGFTVRFAVEVDDGAPEGSTLANHAHVQTSTSVELSTAPVDTLVVGFVPAGMVGLGSITFSGNAIVDSFDSASGSRITEDRDGHLASNGDIVLDGTNIVHGDARPGPDGGQVVISGASRVDGSTAPLPSPVVLKELDASAVATTNANRLVCRVATACQGVMWDPGARTLRVDGQLLLSPGAYHLCGLDVRGVLRAEGPVAIWIGGPEHCPGGSVVRLSSGGIADVDTGRTRDLQLLADSRHGGLSVELRSQAVLLGIVYSPGARLLLSGGAALFGTAFAGEIVTGAGGVRIHVDRSLGSG